MWILTTNDEIVNSDKIAHIYTHYGASEYASEPYTHIIFAVMEGSCLIVRLSEYSTKGFCDLAFGNLAARLMMSNRVDWHNMLREEDTSETADEDDEFRKMVKVTLNATEGCDRDVDDSL